MKIKYHEGDIFFIPMKNGKYAICQVVFAPVKDFKQVLGFCVLGFQDNNNGFEGNDLAPLTINDMGKDINVIFTGNQNLKDKSWPIISHESLTEEKERLKIFNYAGGVFCGEEEIKRIPPSEYKNYTSMTVFGFDLVQNILMENYR